MNKYLIKVINKNGKITYEEFFAKSFDEADTYFIEWYNEWHEQMEDCDLLAPKEQLELLSTQHDFDIVRYSDVTLHATINCEGEMLETYYDESCGKWC